MTENQRPFPLLKEELTSENCLQLDLSPNNQKLLNINFDDELEFQKFINEELASAGKTFANGGYLEERNIYRRSDLFLNPEEHYRNIHLGVDVWAEEYTSIYSPFDGELIAAHNNSGYGDYGPTLIMKYFSGASEFFLLFGHLSMQSLDLHRVGAKISRGARLAELGAYAENGNWPPHVHVQMIKKLEKGATDHIGVCAEQELELWKEVCPDPARIIR